MVVDFISQEQGHRTWSIIRLFYSSLRDFRDEFERYERLVEGHANALGVDRASLRLNPQELAALLRFKNLERLRDGSIHELKELCHLLFRTEDHTDWLDRYVSDIFHEISILKEEHYTLKTYAPMYERDQQKVELQYILDEAHMMFPQKLRHILYLFGKARERMEEHLPQTRSLPIVIRSLYLRQEDDFVRSAYPGGLRDFYRFIYPLGPFEGFYQVAQSFYHSGFFDEALKAFLTAEGEYREALSLYSKLETATNERTSQEEAASPLAEDESTRDPRLTLRSLRAKVGRIRKRQVVLAGTSRSEESEVDDGSAPSEPEAAEAATGQ